MHIAVAGGTGVVGRYVVELARQAGHEVTVIARANGIDLTTGQGLADALRPGSVVVDVSNVAAIGRRRATAFFDAAAANLHSAERQAGAAHHVLLSIVGIDRVRFGYYQAKLRQEELVAAGPTPWTVLRATQFHEFPAQLLARSRGPLVLAPGKRSQPVAAREVAQELLRLASGAPAGRAPELAGPEVHRLPDLVRQVLRARDTRRVVVPVPLPGPADGLLPAADGPRGRQTFADWLAEPG